MLGSNARGHGRVGWRWWLGAGLVLSAVVTWIPQPIYAVVGSFVLAQWRTLLTGLAIVGLVSLLGSTLVESKRPAKESNQDNEAKPLLREIPGWAIWAGMAGLVIVGILATWWLVTKYGNGDAKTIEQNRIKLEAIKLAGSVVVGTGGVAALLLAARRQRVSELDLLQRDRVAEANQHDADERRATELYTAAADQLASDKAPVRMAGLYALSRLGEANKDLRQTIVNLFCAYLRMPDISIDESVSCPNSAPEHEADGEAIGQEGLSQRIVLDLAPAPLAALTSLAPDPATQQRQERQVRLTAQRLLAQHLRPNRDEDGNAIDGTYWSDMDIDLTGANLHEWRFSLCEIRKAVFHGTQFHDTCHFFGTQFRETALFEGAQFHDETLFQEAQFHGQTSFANAIFNSATWFSKAEFDSEVWFHETQFHKYTQFGEARFHAFTWFVNARFSDEVFLEGTRFRRSAWFAGVGFHKTAHFSETRFEGEARFDRAQFDDTVWFKKSKFHDCTRFDDAIFGKQPNFASAWARLPLDDLRKSSWPTGWAEDEVELEARWARLTPDNAANQSSI